MAEMTFEHAPARAPRRSAELSAVLYREFVLLTGNRAALIFGMVPMLVYLLLVATSLSNVVGTVDYNGAKVPFFVFLLPFVVTMSVVGASGTTGMALFQEEMTGVSLQIWSYPLRKTRFLLGKVLGALGLVLAQTALGLFVAVLVFNYPFSVLRWAGLLLAIILTSVTFNGLFLALAVSIKSHRTFTAITSIATLVLVFAGPALSPSQDLPAVLRWISWANPVTYALNAMRDLSVLSLSAAWPSLLVLCAFGVAGNVIAVRGLLRRTREL
jgi:ABC-2 type transport system permease protein